MTDQSLHEPGARDRGLRLMRRARWWVAGTAGAAVLGFSLLAWHATASTSHAKAGAASSSDSGASDSSTSNGDSSSSLGSDSPSAPQTTDQPPAVTSGGS